MRFKTIILFSTLISFYGFSQNDTINQLDENGKKQGHWIIYGKDRPEANYPAEGKIEEGPYVDDRKEGLWIKYYSDGITPKLKGEYHNNRPSGEYWKYYPDGSERESGIFKHNKYPIALSRGGYESLYSNPYTDSLIELNSNKSLRDLELDSNYRDEAICAKLDGTHAMAYNANNELIFDGECRNGKVWNGKVYFFDLDGILLKVEIWEDGVYKREGGL